MKASALRLWRAGFLAPNLTLLLGAGLFASPPRAEVSGFPIITAFSATEIGTNAMGWIAAQDSVGTMYFGCNALVRYDGERWETTPMDHAYALRGLDFGPDGRLWAAATGDIGWFEHQAGDRWNFHSLRPDLPAEDRFLGEVWHVFAEKNGAVFVTENKILRWDGKNFQVWPMPGARRLPATRVNGVIYVHHLSTGLYALKPEGPQRIIPASILGDAAILWLEPRANGWLFATSKGLYTFVQGRLEPFAPEASALVQRDSVTCAVRLPDGRLAVGTIRGGITLIRPDGTLDRRLSEEDGLPTPAIFSLSLDRENGLWATSNSHIFRLSLSSPSTFFSRRSGLPAQPCQAIVRNRGQLIVGTDNRAFLLKPDEKYFVPMEVSPEHLTDLEATESGLLVAGTGGVRRISGVATETVYSTSQDVFVAQPSRFQPGKILVADGRSIVLVDPAGQARVLVRHLPDIATSIAEDSLGRIWLGTTTSGLLLAQPEAASAVDAVPAAGSRGLPFFSGWGSAVAAPDGSILAFASSGGWILGRESQHFEPIAGYPPRGIAAVSKVGADGVAWVVHPISGSRPACVARISVHGNHAIWQPHSVEGLWSIGVSRCILAETSPEGNAVLWIGGTEGILRSAVNFGPVAPKPGAPLLRAVARRSEHDTPQPVTGALPYSTRSVLFELAVPEFSRRPALRLETRVDRMDQEWVPTGAESSRELTAMRDGHYLFRARAVAETGAISDETVFGFVIEPPWWRTGPAIIGGLLALGAAIYGAYRLRVRALRRLNSALEAKVHQRTGQLAQANAAKTQFVASISHDIRNPLNGIVGLSLALDNTRLDARQSEIVATLRECTTYLSTLVDDVLDFASIEAGRVELHSSPFVPAELLRSVVTVLQADTVELHATLIVDVDPALPPTLHADAGRIQQILVNYVTNALKYAGGTIRLAVQSPPDAPDEVEFAVSDEGPGLSAAEQAMLFSKFTRLSIAGRAEVKGAGLGLAACRLLAELMGGSVGVDSRSGRGSRFFLRLPLVAGASTLAVATTPLFSLTVLVVEDTDYNAWAASAVLSKLDLPSERARTGAEALRLCAEKRFDVILLDRNLPDMDGTEVARRLRERETPGQQAILLAVTAYCTADDRAQCLAAGMNAFVGKPLTPEKLRKVLLGVGRRLLTTASVHVPPEAQSSAVDMSMLSYLSDGTDPGLQAQIDRFLVSLTEADAQLSAAFAASDFTALASGAHFVLSQSRMIGGAALAEAALCLEQAARARHHSTLGELLSRVRRELRAVMEALHQCHHAEQRG